MFKAGSIVGDLVLDTGGFASGIRAAEQQSAGFPSMVGANIIAPLLQAAQVATSVGRSIADALAFGVKLAADYETAEVSLKVLLGSAKDAKELMADLQKFADETPFGTEELTKATTLLVGMGQVAKNDVIPTLKKLGDVSALLQGKDIGGMAYIYAQIQSRGTADAEMLNRLAERGVPIWKTLAEMQGVSVKEMHDLASEGVVTGQMVNEAFDRMTGPSGNFKDGMKELAGTYEGLWSTITDKARSGSRRVAEALMEGLGVKGGMQGLSDGMDEYIEGLVDLAHQFGQEVGPELQMLVVEAKAAFHELWPEIIGGAREATVAVRELVAEVRELKGFAGAATGVLGYGLTHAGGKGSLGAAVVGVGNPYSSRGHIRDAFGGGGGGGPIVGEVNIHVDPKATADEIARQIYPTFDEGVDFYIQEATARLARQHQVSNGLGGGR
jgi:tape measure domain-containing protein